MSQILVIDDEPAICWGLERLLKSEGHAVTSLASAEQALAADASHTADLVILDVRLPGMDGLTALPELTLRLPAQTPVIVMTAFGDLQTAVTAVRKGVFDYVTKPFDLDHMLSVVRRALEERPAATAPVPVEADSGLMGISPAMQRVFKSIALVADTPTPVLITGESGVGKEEVALAIHRHSRRREGPFVPICVGAFSEDLVPSELFGHVRGAFTGAAGNRVGMLELANGGTAFLDEIGDISPAIQVKLLRAIERREVTPVGDPRPRPVDFRVIAATHRPLETMCADGTFRQDLYFRLSVFPIDVPPLRERREDIPALADVFLKRLPAPQCEAQFSPAAMNEMLRRSWMGNVRELKNAVEHAAVLARGGTIDVSHLPAPLIVTGTSGQDLPLRLQRDVETWAAGELSQAREIPEPDLHARLLRVVEPPLFQTVLRAVNNHRAEASRLLGIHRATLRAKLRETEDDERSAPGP